MPLADKYAVEKQLRETNQKLLNLNRVASNAIWEWDMRTGQIFRNEPLLDMIGYPIENTKGLAWWLHRIHPEDRDRISDKVKDTAEKRNYHGKSHIDSNARMVLINIFATGDLLFMKMTCR